MVPGAAELADPARRWRVAVLSDTHLRTPAPGGRPATRSLPAAAWDLVGDADAVLHAGDVLDAGVLARLGEHAPLYAVLGNNDLSLAGVLPPTRTVVLGGVSIAMIHDAGPAQGRPARMRRRFPGARVVVFGHSHAPVDDDLDGQLLFNPGSPTQRRAQPVHTAGELVLGGGEVIEHRIVALDGRAAR